MSKRPCNSPLVSIVVPTFNQGYYLRQALDSIMFQDYPDLEIIIANYGSTDETSKLIQKYLQMLRTRAVAPVLRMEETSAGSEIVRNSKLAYPQNREFKIIEGHENIGGTETYNRGFRTANGKYCMYLVGDDYLLPEAVSSLVHTLEQTGADVVYADMFQVNDRGHILQKLVKPDFSFERCFADWFHLGVCRLYRRELHRDYGYYNSAFRNANDYEFMLRLAEAGCSFVHVPRVLYCTRVHCQDGQQESASWRNNGYKNLIKESITCAKKARRYQKALANK